MLLFFQYLGCPYPPRNAPSPNQGYPNPSKDAPPPNLGCPAPVRMPRPRVAGRGLASIPRVSSGSIAPPCELGGWNLSVCVRVCVFGARSSPCACWFSTHTLIHLSRLVHFRSIAASLSPASGIQTTTKKYRTFLPGLTYTPELIWRRIRRKKREIDGNFRTIPALLKGSLLMTWVF